MSHVVWFSLAASSIAISLALFDVDLAIFTAHAWFASFLGFYGGVTKDQHVHKHISFYWIHTVNYVLCYYQAYETNGLSCS
jgi:hypothetical protein